MKSMEQIPATVELRSCFISMLKKTEGIKAKTPLPDSHHTNPLSTMQLICDGIFVTLGLVFTQESSTFPAVIYNELRSHQQTLQRTAGNKSPVKSWLLWPGKQLKSIKSS